MWDDDNSGDDMRNTFVQPPRMFAQMSENFADAEPMAVKIDPEEEAAINAFKDQPAIVTATIGRQNRPH